MKVSLDAKVLADAVTWAARTVPSRPNIPTLGGLLLDAREDELTLSAFDYDVTSRTTIPALVADPGRVVLPARVLAEMAKTLPALPVEMAVGEDAEVGVTCGSAEFGLPMLPVASFPSLPSAAPAIGTVDGSLLKAAAAQVVPAAAHDDTVPGLACVRLDVAEDGLTLAAVDGQGQRLAARSLPFQAVLGGGEHGVLIPARHFHEIARGVGAWPVTIGIGDGIASFETAGRTTTARLVEDKYPNYKTYLAAPMDIWATVDAGPLLDAVKRVALFADKLAPVRLDFTSGAVTLRAGGGEAGRGSETLPAHLDGEDVEVAFQAPYLIDALTAVVADHEVVRIGMRGPAKPTLFTGDVDNPAFRCMVMALRLL